MTEGEFKDRVRYWLARLDELGLSHWDFHYEFAPDGEDVEDNNGRGAEATIKVHRTYDSAWWNIPQDTLGKPEADIDRIIVHELMHVLLRDWNKVDYDMMETIGGQLGRQFDEAAEHAAEGVVERLARAIVVSATLTDS